ncbi:uncharacterized protein LOC143063066 isoform X1 [Mytilus galloprovincialis]|uniref:uncharacterized protein LOC143063066 isoform X1 n=1 Tax=Mytilus galloprovincialis TaxID=29158 RepID=UPI003F7BBEFC
MGNILNVCGKKEILSQNGTSKQPWTKSSGGWTTPDTTVASEFVSTLYDNTSFGSTTLDLFDESTPNLRTSNDPSTIESSNIDNQDEKPRKTVQFDGKIERLQRLECIKQYILDTANREDSALCKAIKEGSSYSIRVINDLIKSGEEDLNFRDNKGDPILYTALFYEQYDVVRLLIEHGAEVNHRNKQWDPIIYTAVQSNRKDIVEIMIKEADADVDCRNSKGDPLLYTAVLSKQKEMVNLLLKYSADPNIRNNLGTSCLEEAMTSDQLDLMQILVESGADIDIKDKEGNNLLHVAMMFKQLKCLEILLDLGADVNIPDKEGNPVLEMAVLMEHTDAITLLLKYGADVNMTNEKGIPVFFKAAKRKGCATMKLMIKGGANVNMQDSRGNTVLFLAVERNNCELLNLLFEVGCDGNIRNHEGLSCIEYALDIKSDRQSVIKTILTSGCISYSDITNRDIKTTMQVKEREDNADNFVSFCDRALFMTSTQSQHHISKWRQRDPPNKYWFSKVNLICDHIHVDCIIDGRLQFAYETLKVLTSKVTEELNRDVKDAEFVEDPHPFKAEEAKSITEFELLLTTKNMMKNREDIEQVTHGGDSMLHLSIKYKHECLLRYLLHNGGNPYKRNRKSRTALQIAFKINEQHLVIPMSYYILRDFTKCVFISVDLYDKLWTGWKCECKRHSLERRELCSMNFIVVVETDSARNPSNFFFKGLDVLFYPRTNQHVELGHVLSDLNDNLDNDNKSIFPELQKRALRFLFTKHSNLRFICPSFVRSFNYSNPNQDHELKREHCLRFILKNKGIIPIEESHLPCDIDGLATDCVEQADDTIAWLTETNNSYRLLSLQTNVNKASLITSLCDDSVQSSIKVVDSDARLTLSDQTFNQDSIDECICVQKSIFTFSLDQLNNA